MAGGLQNICVTNVPERAVSYKNNSAAAKAVKLSGTKLWKHPSAPVRLALACFLLWSLSSFFVAFTAEVPFFFFFLLPMCFALSLPLAESRGVAMGEVGLGVPWSSIPC